MKNKKISRQLRTFAPFVTLGCALMCVSVGFASWIVTSGSDALALGQIQADDIESGGTGVEKDVISVTTDGFQYATNYGFVNDGVYANNVNLTGTCTFNYANAQSCFTSFRNNKSFKLDVTLDSSLSGGLQSKGFKSDSVILTSDNFADLNQNPTEGSSLTTTFTITCSSNTTSNFTFNYTFNLAWESTEDVTSFPDLNGANLRITFLPKENA